MLYTCGHVYQTYNLLIQFNWSWIFFTGWCEGVKVRNCYFLRAHWRRDVSSKLLLIFSLSEIGTSWNRSVEKFDNVRFMSWETSVFMPVMQSISLYGVMMIPEKWYAHAGCSRRPLTRFFFVTCMAINHWLDSDSRYVNSFMHSLLRFLGC